MYCQTRDLGRHSRLIDTLTRFREQFMKPIFWIKPNRLQRLPKAFVWACVLGLMLSSSVWAVDLGAPSIRSFLGQPLDVRIAVIDGNDENMQGALVSLAPVSEWVRSGVNLLPDNLTLQVSFVKEDEDIFVALRSQQSVREPVLQVLLNFQITGQQVSSKPFILFLDPRPQAGTRARNISSSRAVFSRQEQRAEQARATEDAPASVLRSPTPAIPDNRINLEANQYGPVREGETLWSIAERISREVEFTPQQILLALQQANPNALENPDNVNTLRSGVTLNLPDPSTLARTDREQALVLIEEQNRQWQASGRGARLELLRGGEDVKLGISGGGDNVLALRVSRLEEELITSRRENQALREQVGQLEQTLVERESEISLGNSTLADLQQQLEAERDWQSSDLKDDSLADPLADNTAVGDESIGDSLFDQPADIGSDDTADSGQTEAVQSPADDTVDNNLQSDAQQSQATPIAQTSPANNGSRWSWPIWESAGWNDLQENYPWLPKGETGFALLVFVLLLIVVLPLILWFLLRGNRDKPVADSEDLLDRLVTQSASRRATLQEQRMADQSLAGKLGSTDAESISEDTPVDTSSADDNNADTTEDQLDAGSIFAAEPFAEEQSALNGQDEEAELKPEIVEGIDWESESDSDSDSNLTEEALAAMDVDRVEQQPTGQLETESQFDQAATDEALLKPFSLSGTETDSSEATPEQHAEVELLVDEHELNDSQDLEAALDEVLDQDEQSGDLPETGVEQITGDDQLPDLGDFELDDELTTGLADDLELAAPPADNQNDFMLAPNELDQAWSDKGQTAGAEASETDPLDADPAAVTAELEDDLEYLELDDSLAEDLQLEDLQETGIDESVDSSLVAAENDPGTAESGLSGRVAYPAKTDNQTEQEQFLDNPFSDGSEPGQQAVAIDDMDEFGEPVQSSLYGDDSIDVKLDLARAYLAMGDREAMLTILEEIGEAGSEQQRNEVQNMRNQLSS